MFKKRAQAAMEFLMTYGWAILVVLVAIGALAYFGVLSPDKFLPERCTGPAGLDCVDKANIVATGGTVTMALKNNQGYRIEFIGAASASSTDDCTLQSTTVDGTALPAAAAGPGIYVDNNAQTIVVVDCSASNLVAGRFKGEITLPYKNNQTGIAHQATISITGVAS